LRLLFVVNQAAFFVSHRLPLARAARAAGYEVHIAAAPCAGVKALRWEGFTVHTIPLARHGMNPWRELVTLWSLYRLYRRLRPGVVHQVTVKPVLYGSIAARLARVSTVINAVPGLGYLFIGDGRWSAWRRRLTLWGYRRALGRRTRVIVQNPDDRQLLLGARITEPENITLIRGSGVDLERFRPRPPPAGPPVVMFASRLLRDKGVLEFVLAAKRLRARGVSARFVLVGDLDPSYPGAITLNQVRRWQREGMEWWGYREDMAVVLKEASIVCLPSYREGLPKVLLEAAACGRPVVTTDVPGCREAVRHGTNGLLVPPRQAESLADALARLIVDPETRARMGRAGRVRAEAEFGVNRVAEQTLALYRDALDGRETRLVAYREMSGG